MTPADILDFITTRGVSITASVRNEGLEISGPLSALSTTLLDRLRAREAELVAYLRDTETQWARESRALIAQAERIARDQGRLAQELHERENGRPPIDGACVRVDRAMEVAR